MSTTLYLISDLSTEDPKMFLTIKLISREVAAGDPLSGEGETDIGGALREKDTQEVLKIDHKHTQTKTETLTFSAPLRQQSPTAGNQ